MDGLLIVDKPVGPTSHEVVARVGLDYVKSQVVADAARRSALAQRLQFALQHYADPWSQRAAADAPEVLRREFEPLAAGPSRSCAVRGFGCARSILAAMKHWQAGAHV